MKRKYCKYLFTIVILLLSLTSVPIYATPMAAYPVGEVNPPGRGALDYETAYGPIFDELDTDAEYGWYSIWDLDGSGTAEVIIGHGTSSDDYMNDVWSVDDAVNPIYIGSFGSECELYQDPDGHGIFAVNLGKDGNHVVHLSIKDGCLISETVKDTDMISHENIFDENLMLITADIRNLGNLERWSFLEGIEDL